jgi:hypothetical protein
MRKPLFSLAVLAISGVCMSGCSLPSSDTGAASAAPHQVVQVLATATSVSVAIPTAPPVPTNTPEPTEVPWPTVPVPATVHKNISLIEGQAAEIRGLQKKEDVPEIFITPKQLHDYFAAHVGTGYTIEEAQQDEMEAWLMRLISKRDVNLKETAVEVHTENILGFYSPDMKELFVVGDRNRMSPQAKETLAHEYTHALQDQHFGLTKLVQQYSDDSDRRLAMRALIEGDAEVSGLTYSYVYQSNVDWSKQQQVPQQTAKKQADRPADGQGSYVGKTIYFPYIQGGLFVLKLMDIDSYSSVNLGYQDPPVSTEQILHPEKFIKTPHDNPKYVELPDLTPTLGDGWKLVRQDTAGEWELRMVLEETQASNPEEAAAGWGGARYSFYSKPDGTGLIFLHTTWDTPKDADEFEAAVREGLNKLTKQDGTVWTEGGRYFALKRVGSDLYYIASTHRGALEAAWQVAK